jgi:hypothetical protein
VRWKQKKRISYIPSCEEELTTRPLAKKGPKESVPPSSTSSSWATGIQFLSAIRALQYYERLREGLSNC